MTSTLTALPYDDGKATGDYDPEANMDGHLRKAAILMGILVFGFGGAATLIPIGGAVIGAGQLGVESRVKKIAHPIGGTIETILVENGQHVRKGQALVRLDDKVSGTDAELSALTVDQLLAQRARLEAERVGAAHISFPAALARRADPAARSAMAGEERLFAIRQQEETGLTAQLRARIGQYQEQIGGYQAQIASLRQQSALIEPERKGVRELYDKKLVTLGRLNQLERTAVDLTGNIGSLVAQIASAQARISETQEQIIQTRQTRRSDAGTQLAQVNGQLNQQQVRSVSALDVHDRTTIRAPYDGVVTKLAVSTIGGVIRPAEEILEIVPDQDRLLVEGAISPNDVDQVHVNQPARVRLSALNTSITPEIKGRVTYVGADRTTDADGQNSYFPVRIEIDLKALKQQNATVLKSGMPVELFIETGSRSMISYITKPLMDQFARAFRDN